MPSFEAERYRPTPTLAAADALAAIKRDVEIRKLMRELIAALHSLYFTRPDGAA